MFNIIRNQSINRCSSPKVLNYTILIRASNFFDNRIFKMQYRSQRRILCKTEQFELACEIVRGKLNLQLEILRSASQTFHNQLQKKFTKLFCLAYHHELKKHFTTIMYLMQHLKKKDNFQINPNQGAIIVYQPEGKLKKNPKTLGTIQLEEITLARSEDKILKSLFNLNKKQSNLIRNSIKKEKAQSSSQQESNYKSKQRRRQQEEQKYQTKTRTKQKQENGWGNDRKIKNGKRDRKDNTEIQQMGIKKIIDLKISEIREEHVRTTKKLKSSVKQLQQQINYLRKKLMHKQSLLEDALQKIDELKKR